MLRPKSCGVGSEVRNLNILEQWMELRPLDEELQHSARLDFKQCIRKQASSQAESQSAVVIQATSFLLDTSGQ